MASIEFLKGPHKSVNSGSHNSCLVKALSVLCSVEIKPGVKQGHPSVGWEIDGLIKHHWGLEEKVGRPRKKKVGMNYDVREAEREREGEGEREEDCLGGKTRLWHPNIAKHVKRVGLPDSEQVLHQKCALRCVSPSNYSPTINEERDCI